MEPEASSSVEGNTDDQIEQQAFQELSAYVRQVADGLRQLDTRLTRDFAALNDRVNWSRHREEQLHGNFEGLRQRVEQPGVNAMATLPSLMKLPKLGSIDGKDEKKLRRFFRKVEGYLAAYQLPFDDHRAIFFVAQFFEGNLEDWWENRQRLTGDNIRAGFDNVTGLRDAVFAEFRGRDPAEEARDLLAGARQTGSVKDFANYIRRQLLYVPDRSDADNLHTFKRGLRGSLAAPLAMRKPKSFAEAVELALEIEAARNYARKPSEERRPQLYHLRGDASKGEANADDEMSDDGVWDSEDSDYAESEEEGRLNVGRADERRKARPPEEVARERKENGKCYACGKKGHLARECKQRPPRKKEDSSGEE